MNGEQGRESYDDNRSHDLPRIYEVSGIDTNEESSTSSFIEVDSNSNIIACILILLLVESSCDQSRCIIDLHCGRTMDISAEHSGEPWRYQLNLQLLATAKWQ
jgi:hypothetical protein